MTAAAFFEKVRADEALRARVQAAGSAPNAQEAAARLVAIAEGEGITFTVGDVQREYEHRVRALDDDQLDQVSGGGSLLLPAVQRFQAAPPPSIIAILIG